MINKKIFILIISLIALSCDYIDCNYDKLTEKELKTITELNLNTKSIDTIYNDECIKGFLHVYLIGKTTDNNSDDEIEEVMKKLINDKMKRDIWVFNNRNEFLYRLNRYTSNNQIKVTKTDLQYPNQ